MEKGIPQTYSNDNRGDHDHFPSRVPRDFGERIEREENAWQNLVERGNYSYIVLYYNTDAPDDIETTCVSDMESDSGHGAEEKCSPKTESFHLMVTRSRGKRLDGSSM